MTTKKGARQPARPRKRPAAPGKTAPGKTKAAAERPEATKTAGPPQASPESLAPTVHDATFEGLVRHVAAELPQLEDVQALQPFPWPRVPVRRSGIYTRRLGPPGRSALSTGDETTAASEDEQPEDVDLDFEAALGAGPTGFHPTRTSEELRVDVDGLYPTMTISGTIYRLFGGRLTWIARVTKDPSTGEYAGPISYRDGTSSLEPHTDIRCKITGSWWQPTSLRAHVTFTGGGVRKQTRVYRYQQANFRDVGIEYDTVEGTASVTSYNLHAHPNRPADLPNATLSIEDVFTRLGLRMTNTNGNNPIPIAEAGANVKWSDLEMHDAMQRHWSMWADVPQWQVWTLFAGQHDMGPSLGGIMFDDIGAAQRQGCAVFLNSFISNPAPAGDPAPAAYVQRMRFWTAVHEIGHTFNLAHSWQKSLGTPWVPLSPEPEARSYMNYVFNVAGGANAFFADFYHRFSDQELLFLRHAPERFVQHGNAPWFDHHGFEQARAASAGALALELRFRRESRMFQALEPIVAEIKLKNTSPVPVVVDRNALLSEDVVVIIERQGREPRQWVPYRRYCTIAEPQVLEPGKSIYAQLYLSAGLNGFDLAEPGHYRIYAALRTDVGDVLAAPTEIRIIPFASREQEFLADELYDEEVGRTLAFGGSRVLDQARTTLENVVDRMPDSRIGMHAAAALGAVAAKPGLVLEEVDGTIRLNIEQARPEQAEPLLDVAYQDLETAADTFGHIRLTEQVTGATVALAEEGDEQYATELTERLADTLEHRGVLAEVVSDVRGMAQTMSK